MVDAWDCTYAGSFVKTVSGTKTPCTTYLADMP